MTYSLTQDEINYLQRTTDALFTALKRVLLDPTEVNLEPVKIFVTELKSRGFTPTFSQRPLKLLVTRNDTTFTPLVPRDTSEEFNAQQDAAHAMRKEIKCG